MQEGSATVGSTISHPGPGSARKLVKHGPVSRTEYSAPAGSLCPNACSSSHPDLPSMLDLEVKPSKPFLLLSSVMVGVFYHNNRKETRTPPNLYFKVGSLLEELQSHVSNSHTHTHALFR